MPESVHGRRPRQHSHQQEREKNEEAKLFFLQLEQQAVKNGRTGHEIQAWDNAVIFPFCWSFTQLIQESHKYIKTHSQRIYYLPLGPPKLGIKQTRLPRRPSKFQEQSCKGRTESLSSPTHKARQPCHSTTSDFFKKIHEIHLHSRFCLLQNWSLWSSPFWFARFATNLVLKTPVLHAVLIR